MKGGESMKMKAKTFHHTHWDAEWYFTEQESQVQFVYHMKELLYALDNGLIDYYHLDGKSCHLDDYFKYCPEDLEKFKNYVKQGKVFIGPLYEQLSCFIAPGESIIKNLTIGMAQADNYGGSSDIAYIPDSFGQTQDYPKIFNGVGIHDFIFRRGMGDEHNLDNDFYWKSNDGSKVMTSVLQAGYSFAGLAFMEGRLIKNAGLNLDKLSIINQMKVLAQHSSNPGTFLLPAGKDNCPVMLNFKSLINQYNEESDEFEFEETTLKQYINDLRKADKEYQEYEGEFYSTQYHRVHKSIFSVRPDIKTVQDRLERLLIYEVQPLMSMLSTLGIKYENQLVENIWKILIRSQTHSEATNSDEVNEQILARSLNAYKYAMSIKIYLTRKIATSFYSNEKQHSLAVFNTLPYERDINSNYVVYTKEKKFIIMDGDTEIPYSIIRQKKVYGGWKRKYRELLDSNRDYYETEIAFNLKNNLGVSYKILTVVEGVDSKFISYANKNNTYIENDRFKVELFEGQISIRNKVTNEFIENAIYFEDSGDQGDTFDYDYPLKDLFIYTSFEDAIVLDSYETNEISSITISGFVKTCKDLKSRALGKVDEKMPFELTIQLKSNSDIIRVFGKIKNKAYNHRTRLVFKTNLITNFSTAGTQFGYINRTIEPKQLKYWKKEKWLEEPTPIEPLLNEVSLIGDKYTYTIFTRSSKEYEILKHKLSNDIAVTLFRSVGHFGLPDLNRRPGRASGIPEEIMVAPMSQMIDKSLEFDLGIKIYDSFDANKIRKDYIQFAVNPVYFENQEFNRIFVSMKYFEINKLIQEIPRSHSLISLKNSTACISTIEKSKKDNAIIVRLYNNENFAIEGGEILCNVNFIKVELVNFREEKIKESTLDVGKLSPGEIRTYKIYID